MKKIKVDGVTYYPAPEINKDSCIGCSLWNNRCTLNYNLNDCTDYDIIYTDQKPNVAHLNIREEMYADMEEGGMPQGEIESCLNHWQNKYIIKRKEK